MALLLAHAAMALHAPPFVRSAARAPSLAAVAAPSDLTQRLISDLTAPDRLEALASCDARRIAYDPFNFWDIIVESLSPAHFSRAFGLILPTLCGLAAWGLSLTWLLRRPEVAGLSELIGPYTALSGSLLTPVSFLLVFRIGRAAARFWDARAALGAIIEKCRSAASTSALTYASTPELRDQFSRWLSVLPIAARSAEISRDHPRSAKITRGQPRSAEVSRGQPRSAEISRGHTGVPPPPPLWHARAGATRRVTSPTGEERPARPRREQERCEGLPAAAALPGPD